MKIGIKYLFEKKPSIKVVIFAGKGGLGKTTCSAALSYQIAFNLKKKVLCFSTDPQASLSDIFERDLFGKGEISMTENLFVLEIDADKRIKEYVEETRRRIKEMYKIDEIPKEVDDYIESAAAEPAMYESAVYDAMLEVVTQGKYDYYIFDMPPFGHGIRMVAMADLLSKWVDKITEARRQAFEYEAAAAAMKRQKITEREDMMLKELEDIRNRIVSFRNLVVDPNGTAFIMVLIPEKMAILDTERAIKMFEDLGLRVGGVVVNQVYPPWIIEDPKASEYLKRKVASQKPLLKEIIDKFSDMLVGLIPMYNKEPKGFEMLSKVAQELWESSFTIENLIGK
jgi:arsenite-transporting ATPase